MASDSKGSQVLLFLTIFFFLVGVSLSFAAYIVDAQWQRSYEDIQTELHTVSQVRDMARMRINQRDEALALIVGPNAGNVPRYDNLRTETVQNYFLPAAEAMTQNRQELALIRTQDTSQTPPAPPASADAMRDFYTKGEGASFERVISDLLSEVHATVLMLPKLQAELEAERALVQSYQQSGQEQIRYAEQQKDQVRTELTHAQDEILELNRQNDLLQRNHQDEITRLEEELDRQLERARIEQAQLQSEVLARQQRISELQERRERTLDEMVADGQVSYVENELGLVWIDLTASDGVRRGQVFEVFQYVRGGEKEIRGLVEVRDVGETISQAAIIDAYFMRDQLTGEMRPMPRAEVALPTGWTRVHLPNPEDPVIQGDLLQSPFYDQVEPPVFVFIGSRLTNERYGMTEMEQRIVDAGCRVDPQVTIETDFAIVLDDAREQEPDELARAIQYGIILLHENDALEYVGRQ